MLSARMWALEHPVGRSSWNCPPPRESESGRGPGGFGGLAVFDAARGPVRRGDLDDHPAAAIDAVARRFEVESATAYGVFATRDPGRTQGLAAAGAEHRVR